MGNAGLITHQCGSQVGLLKDSLVAFDLGYDDEQGKKMLDIANKLWGWVHCMRMMGSSALALAYVACGRMTLYLHRHIYPWDIASGLLLIREAGGKVTDWQGNQASFRNEKVIASNSTLHQQISEYLD
jgi:myo-inositol-1(or 4)-monophosphatase